jgi:Dolichyl-phosphate-mannose-protein mannosyltransferase
MRNMHEGQRPTSIHHLILLGVLFVTALGIRLYHINEPPLNFHAVRQYHSLLIARGYYYEAIDDIPEWKRQVVRTSVQRREIWEPHVMESLVSFAYRIVGGEHYWIPRLLSSVFWLIGGGFLLLIALKIADANAAVFSTAFYLFLPFGVVASRSFQPDPLMVTALLGSVFAILKYYEQPSVSRLLIAATVSGLAICVKFVSLFAICGVFVSVGIWTLGLRRFTANRRTLLFAAASVLPALILYSYRILVSKSLLGVAQGDILPHLILYVSFWRGWLSQIGAVVGYTAFIGGLLGVLMFRDGLSSAMVIGFWLGYFVYGLVFTYTIHTHDYWNLQLIPIVALSLGPVVGVVINRLLDSRKEWYWRTAIGALAASALVLSIGTTKSRLLNGELERKVSIAQEIGARVRHNSNVIYLSGDYGLPLEYHGELSGKPWPLASDLEWERLVGLKSPNAQERYKTRFAKDLPQFFIVENLREFEQQPDLKEFLREHYPKLAENHEYVIFDLQRK